MATTSKPAAAVDPEVAIAHRFPEVSFDYDERDVALYALGVGACGDDAVDDKELHLVYHRGGQPHIKVEFPLGESPPVLVPIGGCRCCRAPDSTFGRSIVELG